MRPVNRQPLQARKLATAVREADRLLKERDLLPEQRVGLWNVRQALLWALRQLDDGAPPMNPTQAAMLGPAPSGGVRRDFEVVPGPKPGRRERVPVGTVRSVFQSANVA